MAYKEKEITKLYYSIGEVAEMFKVSTSLIRFWEGEFSILKPKKNRKGNRLFTQKDLDNLHLIYHLVKERGYTLEGAKNKIQEEKEGIIETFEVIKTLKKLRVFLENFKDSLD